MYLFLSVSSRIFSSAPELYIRTFAGYIGRVESGITRRRMRRSIGSRIIVENVVEASRVGLLRSRLRSVHIESGSEFMSRVRCLKGDLGPFGGRRGSGLKERRETNG